MIDSLYDGRGDDPELAALEEALRPLRFDRPAPALPQLGRASHRPGQATKGGPLAPATGQAEFVRDVAPARPSRGARWTLALSVSLAVGVGAFSLHHSQEEQVRRRWSLTSVLVAAHDIPAGTPLRADMLTRLFVPDQFVTSSVVSPDATEAVLGQTALLPLQAGDPVLWTQFESTQGRDRLSRRVLPKARAVTIAARGGASTGLGANPNDRVDVIAALEDPSSGKLVAITLMQNVVVLASGSGSAGRPSVRTNGADDLSVMVLPEEAELLVLAQRFGTLTTALRSADDFEARAGTPRATLDSLLAGQRARSLDAKRERAIEGIRGEPTSSPALPQAPQK
jgi:pilus assembly protein CpaB